MNGKRVFLQGETQITGKYRDKGIKLTVRVVKPLDGLVDISHRYLAGRFVSLHSGTDVRERIDGALAQADFISPESISAAGDDVVYLTDSGALRKITEGRVETIELPISYLSAAMVRCNGNDVYILTDPWQEGDKYYYALVRLGFGLKADLEPDLEHGRNSNSNADLNLNSDYDLEPGRGMVLEAVYITDAVYSKIEDFDFDDGLLYFIDRNEGLGGTFLKTLDLYDVEDIKTLCRLPDGASALSVSEDGSVYIGNSETGVILIYRDDTLEFFAGLEGERAFIDGSSPRFYSPQRLEYRDNYLYIFDFNTIRRIEAANGVAGECITLAGVASPTFVTELDTTTTAAEDAVLPYGKLMDFAVTRDGVLLTDHKHGVVWRVG